MDNGKAAGFGARELVPACGGFFYKTNSFGSKCKYHSIM
jgi:hypothetical protein